MTQRKTLSPHALSTGTEIFFSAMRPRAKDRPRDFAIHTAPSPQRPPRAQRLESLLLLEARGQARECVQRVHRRHPLDVERAEFIDDAFVSWREQAELRRGRCGPAIAGNSRHPGLIQFALLEVG